MRSCCVDFTPLRLRCIQNCQGSMQLWSSTTRCRRWNSSMYIPVLQFSWNLASRYCLRCSLCRSSSRIYVVSVISRKSCPIKELTRWGYIECRFFIDACSTGSIHNRWMLLWNEIPRLADGSLCFPKILSNHYYTLVGSDLHQNKLISYQIRFWSFEFWFIFIIVGIPFSP